MLNAQKGTLLISEPTLTDPVFFKSVILLTHHTTDESIGLVLNQPTKIHLNEILNDIPLSDFPVYIGGPVEKNSIHFIHTLGDLIPNTKMVTDGLYWGGDFRTILSLMSKNEISKDDIRFFAGYSGWGENQLDEEIRESGWIINKANINICMQYSSPSLWTDLIKKKSKRYAMWANMPINPNLN